MDGGNLVKEELSINNKYMQTAKELRERHSLMSRAGKKSCTNCNDGARLHETPLGAVGWSQCHDCGRKIFISEDIAWKDRTQIVEL